MKSGGSDTALREAILAAAAIVGVPVELHEGPEWSVMREPGGGEPTVRIGLAALPDADPDVAAARAILLLWESVREERQAPQRRARRLALARRRPATEPALAAIDRMLASAAVLRALPGFRAPLVRAVLRDLPELPGELPRHLQWLVAQLAWVDPSTRAALLAGFAPEVREEALLLDQLVPGHDVLRAALSAELGLTPLERFERVYGLLLPPYERLLAQDLGERGLGAGVTGVDQGVDDADPQPTGAAPDPLGAGSTGGAERDAAQPGGEGTTDAADEHGETARAGDREEVAEGADLFAAEQAGFVRTVLATPLPADGEWADGVLPPETESSGPARDRAGGAGGGGGEFTAQPTTLADYRDRAAAHAGAIDAVREAWQLVIAERIGVRSTFTRSPQREGEVLAREHLVGIVTDVAAGVSRPRGYLRREQTPRRVRRSGSTDFVLLIDRSASMQGAAAEAAGDAALVLVESLAAVQRDIAAEEQALGIDLELSLRTALIVFDSEPTVVKPLSASLDDAARRLMHAAVRTPGGSTNDAAALQAAGDELGVPRRGGGDGSGADRQATGSGNNSRVLIRVSEALERHRVVLFVSDGGTDDGGAAAAEIARLRSAGVSVFGIGIRTPDVANRFAPHGVRANDPAELGGLLTELITNTSLAEGR